MKSILITVFLMAGFSAFCQTIDEITKKLTTPHAYMKDTSIDKYLGTWERKQGADLFRITLMKTTIEFPGERGPSKFEALNGYYLYQKDGSEIVNTYKTNEMKFAGGSLPEPGKLTLSFSLTDRTYGCMAKVFLTGSGKNSVLHWKYHPTENIIINRKVTEPLINLPDNMVLRKKGE